MSGRRVRRSPVLYILRDSSSHPGWFVGEAPAETPDDWVYLQTFSIAEFGNSARAEAHEFAKLRSDLYEVTRGERAQILEY